MRKKNIQSVVLSNNKEIQYRVVPFRKRLWMQRQLMLMSVPMLLYILLFNYFPVWGWITAFMNYNPAKPLFSNEWVGIENFVWLFSKPEFIRAIRNTFAMAAINLVFGFVFPIALALFLNEIRSRKFKRSVQTVTYLPHFLSWVIVVGIAQTILASDGAVNRLLLSLGIIHDPIFFLGEGKYFWWLVGGINLWKECGWNSIIYLAAMAAIDPALYEAADMDGAGRFKKMFHITLPGIKSTFVVLLVMNIGYLMEAGFEIQYLMGQNIVMDWSQTVDIFALKYGITKGQYSRAIAAGIFKSVVSIVLMLSANYTAKRLNEDTLL
ncbi:MAG TPA: ABC transporter permease subunit [Candidatus Limiplasma sp.]|nr:ABC transporter permease subunit [Candidatus Limiplasma sp.]HRX07935.1 ABC transporter permease subunit [Candidatus Limiplasma sp.]